MFLDPGLDPRENGDPGLGDERATLIEFLRCQRLTLQVKCDGLDADQLAHRSVAPSTLSLLGLVRHMADVERAWFRRRLAAQDAAPLFFSDADADGEFTGAVGVAAVVDDAFAAWRIEVSFAEQFTADTDDLGYHVEYRAGDGSTQAISLREVLVHMIEEYARHNGHADLLRERIDGRVGQ